MKYNLFLDDLREVEAIYTDKTNFTIVRSFKEFVHCINILGLPIFISFDNDLGEDKEGNLLPDGYACAKWLVYESNLNLKNLQFKVYSANPVARVQIQSLLTNYIKFLKEG